MSDLPLYAFMADLLRRGESFSVVTVLETAGSAPRGAGAKMVVRADGSTSGTVGGGRLEAEAAGLGREAVRAGRVSVHSYRLDGEAADADAMVCGGSGRLLVDYVDAASETERRIFLEAAEVLEGGGGAWIVTDLDPGAERAVSTGRRCLLREGGGRIGSVGCDPAVLERLSGGAARHAFRPFLFQDGRFLAEPVRRRGTVHLFGAGHVGRNTAALCVAVGFHAIVYEDRPSALDRKLLPEPIRTVAVGSFPGIRLPPLGADDYVVIATRGHAHDGDVLERALTTEPGYVGMIGSRRKKEALFRDLLGRGVPEGALRRVHTPIGLAIGAETPEEIAVSIVGELIAARAEREKGWKEAVAGIAPS